MDEKFVRVICPYCGVGCGLFLRVVDNKYVGIEYDYEHPVNNGKLCPKANDFSFLISQDRLKKPLKRTESGFKEISWRDAIREIASVIKDVAKKYGPDSIGFIASAKCFNEENYLIQKLARLLGTNNVDHCARLCHSPTLLAMSKTMGIGGLTGTYHDIAESEVIVTWGTNPAETYPVLFKYIIEAKRKGSVLIVVDPRRTRTAWFADIHIQLKPGTDIVVANALMNVIISERLYDEEFIRNRTKGFDQLLATVKKYTPEMVEEISNVPSSLILETARIMGSTRKGSLLWSMGVTQHSMGYYNVLALINLAALLGWYGKPGTCVGGLRGQNNVQGASYMGALPEFLPGLVSVLDDAERIRIASLWGVDEIPSEPGLALPCLISGAGNGDIRVMYIVGSNPAISMANSTNVVKNLEKLDFLVVEDIFMTETAALADILLPAAAWAEKEGSFISTERRIQWSFKALDPPGEARPDLSILISISRELGLGRYFPYSTPEDVLVEINKVIPALAGATPERLKNTVGGVIYPCYSIEHPGTRILYVDEFNTPDGKLVLIPVEHKQSAELPDEEYPLILTTHRVVGVYHSNTMTGRSQLIAKRWREPEVLINPATARRHGIEEGDVVKLITRRGEYTARARIVDDVPEYLVSLPWHWGANVLTNDALDPVSKIPETKVCACRIVKTKTGAWNGETTDISKAMYRL
ncbi:MAG: formate dehydrogenase subunit alpha [Desulfurococcaceae archaeon]